MVSCPCPWPWDCTAQWCAEEVRPALYLLDQEKGRHGKQVLSLVLEGLRLNPLLCHLALNTVIQYRYRWLLVKECLEVINKAPQENRIMWIKKKKRNRAAQLESNSKTVLGRVSLWSKTNTFPPPESAQREWTAADINHTEAPPLLHSRYFSAALWLCQLQEHLDGSNLRRMLWICITGGESERSKLTCKLNFVFLFSWKMKS